MLTPLSEMENNVSMSRRPLYRGVDEAASQHPNRVAIRAGDDAWTWAELQAMTHSFAHRLADLGVSPGTRVAVMLSNRVEFPATVYAIARLGAAAVLLSPAWKAAEIGHAVGLTEPKMGVADGASVEVLRDRLGAGKVIDLDDPDDAAAAFGGDPSPLSTDVDETSETVLVFSSGTTGMPKAVRHTHRSLAVGTDHWVATLGLGPDDRFQVATPPSHILGLLNLLAAARAGVTVRLHARFDLDAVLGAIESDRLTLEMAVAPIALAMANHPDLESYDLTSLRYILWGATPVTPSVAETVTRRTGVRWMPGYGASELPVISVNPVDDPDAWRLDSVGLPPAGVEMRVADLESGDVVGAGETGEIQVRSDSVMAGYLPEEANADAFTADGWYRTGDVGWLEPDGWVHLTDRSKEMIKVKGFQVAPAEIETVLLGHPSVVDCAVFGVADQIAGEVPVAAVQIDARVVSDTTRAFDASETAGELQQLVADTLATYKQLRHVVIVDTIPRLPSGKVLRRTLRDEWAETLSRSVS